jgi:hypothetical protein
MPLMIADMFRQLQIPVMSSFVVGIWFCDTTRNYIHYDELEPFTKLNSFKGVGVSDKGTIVLQFVD